jgi:1,6-anhydro-N-acetylmuramate kinase
MAARIDDDYMTAEHDGRVIATARRSAHAAAGGQGAWAVSDYPSRLFTRNQAITAMVLAERLAAGYGDDDVFVIGWREELGL